MSQAGSGGAERIDKKLYVQRDDDSVEG